MLPSATGFSNRLAGLNQRGALLENRGRIVSRERLMQRLWETDSFVDENTLTVNVTRLRKTLSSIGAEALIVTKKGMGYLIP